MIPSSSAFSTSVSTHADTGQHASAACFTMQIAPNQGYVCPVLHAPDTAQHTPADEHRTRPWCDDESARRLLEAAESGDIQQLWRLQDQGIKINARDGCGYTAFQRAIAQGKVAAATLLRKVGAKVDARDGAWQTPLLTAVEAGCRPAVTALLSWHADPNRAAPVSGTTPLISAARRGDAEMVKELLRAGARLGACDRNGDTALHVAGSGAVVDLLSTRGADIDMQDGKGKTPLLRAIERGDTQSAQALKERTREWPIGLLKSMVFSGSAEMMRLVLSWSADLRLQAQSEPLKLQLIELAIQLGHDELLRAMKTYGIHVAPRPEHLYEAAQRGHADVVRTLLEWDPPRTERRAGWFSSETIDVPRALQSAMSKALYLAARHEHLAVLNLLLDEADDAQASSLLHDVVKEGNLKVVELLLGRNVRADRLLDLATARNDTRMMSLLLADGFVGSMNIPFFTIPTVNGPLLITPGTRYNAACIAIKEHASAVLLQLIQHPPALDPSTEAAERLWDRVMKVGRPADVEVLLQHLYKDQKLGHELLEVTSDPVILTLLQCWPLEQSIHAMDLDFNHAEKLHSMLSKMLEEASLHQLKVARDSVKRELYRTSLIALNAEWAQTIVWAQQSILHGKDANKPVVSWKWLTQYILIVCLPRPDYEFQLGPKAGTLSCAAKEKMGGIADRQYKAMRTHCASVLEYWFAKYVMTLASSCLDKTSLSLAGSDKLAQALAVETGLLHEPAHLVSLCWDHALRAASESGNLNCKLMQLPQTLGTIMPLFFASEFSRRYGEAVMQSRPDAHDFRGIVSHWQKRMILRYCDAVLMVAASALAPRLARPRASQAIDTTRQREDARS